MNTKPVYVPVGEKEDDIVVKVLNKLEQRGMPKDMVAAIEAANTKQHPHVRLMLTYPFDLRGVNDKIEALKSNDLCTGWMVFLNQSCSLAHIMHKEDVDTAFYFRMKVPSAVKGAHPEFLRKWFYSRLKDRIVI